MKIRGRDEDISVEKRNSSVDLSFSKSFGRGKFGPEMFSKPSDCLASITREKMKQVI